ncbi:MULTISPECIES: DapH/DapD/GlmU-related protein [Staphylococcus]|uniref:DapH/DapD/GlmU-related protein n=1 Tax=Staphylococcus TaxID=1279 RepID=UPI0002463AB3|nr:MULTISPECIES: DapH/DapD/GlmU-related protein [Staphylococcus]QAV30777.1 acetyltransferase [Sulfitobacter donghicola]AGZ25633.1 putative acetyltransferase [Staphylococcus pasteuri SP1]KAB7644725.1 sugar O-acetyltransferase [Staphylococcus sp. B2-b]MBN6853244.1 sugar O-acetyltransferase [Staphylococcus warneri]MBT2770002.1 sugar O-acetyltransferase [Staphylococcus warneri]
MFKSVLSENIWNRVVEADESVYREIHKIVDENAPIVSELNSIYQNHESTIELLSRITGQKVDSSVGVNLPLYTDFGRHISIGKDVFINNNVMFTDLGGITLEDRVLIGPRANLLTVNHPTNPSQRRGLIVKPITVKENAWIGAASTILPGVIIGENAIVGANSLVTKDVPANTIVAGSPARVIKTIEEA